MTTLMRAVEMIREWIPDLEERISQFETESFEPDEEILDAFRQELKQLSGDLQAAMDAGDDQQHRLAAHSIKGMSGTMGLPEISVLAQEIEITMRAGERDRCAQLSRVLIGWARDVVATC